MSPNNWKILRYCSENNFPFFGLSVALYLREIQPPPKYLHASNPPAVSSSNRCRYLPNCLFEIFQCFASTSGAGGVPAQRLGSDRGQSGLEQPLLLANWDFLLFRQTEFKGKHLRHETVCPHRARLILHTETVASHGVWIMMTTATSAVAWWSRSRLFNWPQFQDQPLQCNASPDLTSGTAKVLTTFLLSCLSPHLEYSYYRTSGVNLGPIYGFGHRVTPRPRWDWTDISLTDEDTNSILINTVNRAILCKLHDKLKRSESISWAPCASGNVYQATLPC